MGNCIVHHLLTFLSFLLLLLLFTIIAVFYFILNYKPVLVSAYKFYFNSALYCTGMGKEREGEWASNCMVFHLQLHLKPWQGETLVLIESSELDVKIIHNSHKKSLPSQERKCDPTSFWYLMRSTPPEQRDLISRKAVETIEIGFCYQEFQNLHCWTYCTNWLYWQRKNWACAHIHTHVLLPKKYIKHVPWGRWLDMTFIHWACTAPYAMSQ